MSGNNERRVRIDRKRSTEREGEGEIEELRERERERETVTTALSILKLRVIDIVGIPQTHLGPFKQPYPSLYNSH